ncbi:MAG: cell division ATPase MinD [Candidatus Hydrothermarchaeaceae archaeon]
MTRVIVVASGKGGVGKTTIAGNLGVALATFGKRVAVLDADVVMANLEILMGLRNPPVSLIDVLGGRLDIDDVIYEGLGGVKIIPAGITLDGFNEENMEMLKAAIKEIPKDIEILVIDAPAGRDAAMVMDKGQEVLIVTAPEVSSVSDALKMKILAEKMGAKTIGSILNMVENRSGELSRQEVENTLDLSIICKIPYDTKIKDALAYEIPFIIRYPRIDATQQTLSLAAGLIGRKYTPPVPSIFSKISAFFKSI